jgi:hypothetical protein
MIASDRACLLSSVRAVHNLRLGGRRSGVLGRREATEAASLLARRASRDSACKGLCPRLVLPVLVTLQLRAGLARPQAALCENSRVCPLAVPPAEVFQKDSQILTSTSCTVVYAGHLASWRELAPPPRPQAWTFPQKPAMCIDSLLRISPALLVTALTETSCSQSVIHKQ